MNSTKPKVTTAKFMVKLEIDNEAWAMNYDPNDVGADIRTHMGEVIQELIVQYLRTSGNEGSVNVTPR